MQKSPSINVECVPTENKAIEIGKVVCSSVYPQINLEEQKWECIENTEKNEWIVFCYKGYVLGGGLPEIHINKTTAEITSISLVK